MIGLSATHDADDTLHVSAGGVAASPDYYGLTVTFQSVIMSSGKQTRPMRRLLRLAFNFEAAVSAVLLIAMVWLVTRSREVSDTVFVHNGRFLIGVYLRWGRIEFGLYDMRDHRANFSRFLQRTGWTHFSEQRTRRAVRSQVTRLCCRSGPVIP